MVTHFSRVDVIEVGNILVTTTCVVDYVEYRCLNCDVQITHSPFTLGNLTFINFVYETSCLLTSSITVPHTLKYKSFI